MPTYKISAKRETCYDFEIEADSEQEALEEMNRIQMYEDVEVYAIDWYPLDITDIEEEEE